MKSGFDLVVFPIESAFVMSYKVLSITFSVILNNQIQSKYLNDKGNLKRFKRLAPAGEEALKKAPFIFSVSTNTPRWNILCSSGRYN